MDSPQPFCKGEYLDLQCRYHSRGFVQVPEFQHRCRVRCKFAGTGPPLQVLRFGTGMIIPVQVLVQVLVVGSKFR